MPAFIIDAPHRHSNGSDKSALTEKANAVRIINMLNEQPGTKAYYGGAYRQDPSLCQIIVVSPMSEKELDDLLYATPGIDYIGTCTTSPA